MSLYIPEVEDSGLADEVITVFRDSCQNLSQQNCLELLASLRDLLLFRHVCSPLAFQRDVATLTLD